MIIEQPTPEVNVVASRSNGRDYNLTIEFPAGHVEVPVAESTYRRALIDFLSQTDIEELQRWNTDRDAEVIHMHEAEFGKWPPVPSDDVLEDKADYYAGQARANGFVLGMKSQKPADKLAELTNAAGYETVEEYLDDAAYELFIIMLEHDCHISREDARQHVIDSDGDVQHAAEMLLEDMDMSDPKQEAHFSPWYLNN